MRRQDLGSEQEPLRRILYAAKEERARAHVPPPVVVWDVLSLGHGPILLPRVIDLLR